MMSMSGSPLVSIGIPTYERPAMLARALDSALAQSHANLEVIIADNASGDGTEALCREVATRDPRVRYLRHEHNLGPTANFNHLFYAFRGDYVMMLADDDWLDPGYVAACLAELRADSAAALVAGWARYVRDREYVCDGVRHRHLAADPRARVREYLASVDDNGVFYGLMPRAVLERARPLPNVLGNDWLHVARIAAQGSLRTLDTVRIHRELGGTSSDIASILSTFGRSGRQARAPQLVIGWQLLRDIGWTHPVYARLGRLGRLVLALSGAIASMRWRALGWHLITPAIAGLARRPRGRPVWALYDRVTRALGAGRRP
jgi:glycosyltransferase involved in cell wall biosynthesis